MEAGESTARRATYFFARAFVLAVTIIAYIIALVTPVSIFELAVRFRLYRFGRWLLSWWLHCSEAQYQVGRAGSTLWVAFCLAGTGRCNLIPILWPQAAWTSAGRSEAGTARRSNRWTPAWRRRRSYRSWNSFSLSW